MKYTKSGMLVGALLVNLLNAEARSLSNAEFNVVRADVQRINSQLDKTRRARADIPDQSTEGGKLTNFWRGKVLLKSSAIYYGEMGQSSREVWYRDGAPFFVFEQTRFYDSTLSGHVVRREEKRYYLRNGRLLAWKFGSKWQNLSPVSQIALEKETANDKKNARRAP